MTTNIATIAAEIASSLSSADRTVGEAEARRLAFSFVEAMDKAAVADLDDLVGTAPGPVGDARFDALLAAVVEHGCARRGLSAPRWVNEADRFLETWWFVSGLSSLHADALVHSPISFARRGVFITAGALSYA